MADDPDDPDAPEAARRDSDEPRIQPPPSTVEARLNRALERLSSVLSSLVALVLIGLVLVALAGVLIGVHGALLHQRDPRRAVVHGLDATLLAIIVLELVHTTLTRGPMSRQLQEFVAIGITSGVRSGLHIAAAETSSTFEIARDLAFNSLGVLALVAALWLVRHRLHADRRAPRSEPAED